MTPSSYPTRPPTPRQGFDAVNEVDTESETDGAGIQSRTDSERGLTFAATHHTSEAGKTADLDDFARSDGGYAHEPRDNSPERAEPVPWPCV